jgi:hypothetical protein
MLMQLKKHVRLLWSIMSRCHLPLALLYAHSVMCMMLWAVVT